MGMDIYRSYQRSLWNPAWRAEQADNAAVEEWSFRRYGPFGIFMVDMRGSRVAPDGTLYDVAPDGTLPPILSERQKASIKTAFASDGLTCMLICSEIPFIGEDPNTVKQKAEIPRFVFLKSHWVHALEDLLWMLDTCFEWKAAVPGRELLMLTGDIHVGVDSTITDTSTGHQIRHLTTSPITNEVKAFFTSREGCVSERYSYVSKPVEDHRNFGVINLECESGIAKAEVELVCVPTYVPPKQ